MSLKRSSIGRRLRRRTFITSWWGALIFSSHILRHSLCRTIRGFAPQVTGSVLDLGCGSKPYEELFSGASEYIGIDVEQSGHDHTSSKVDVFFDGTHIPFPDKRFHSIVCFEVFEHVPDLRSLLGDVCRVLQPGGTFLASLPFLYNEHEAPYDFRRLTRYGIAEEWKVCGLQIEAIVPTTSNWLAIQQLWISFLVDRVLPGRHDVVKILSIPLVALLNLAAYLTNAVLPNPGDMPLNYVVLARRPLTA